VVNAAAVAIAVIDAPGKVIYSNQRAGALMRDLGNEMPADLDRAIDIFHPDGRRYEQHEWPAVRSLTSGEEVVEEFFYAVPEGGRLWVRCSSWPVRDSAGEIVAAALAMTDVTERKREEGRLAYLAGLLNNTEDAWSSPTSRGSTPAGPQPRVDAGGGRRRPIARTAPRWRSR
jgi:PAS domain S-box-containing protein